MLYVQKIDKETVLNSNRISNKGQACEKEKNHKHQKPAKPTTFT